MDIEDKWLDRNCWTNKSRLYRYFALLNLFIVGFGVFVAYDSLGALQESIMKDLDLNAQHFSYLYSVGSWPATVLCFFAGFLIDSVFGIKIGTMIYTLVVFFGHLIFSLGVLMNSFWCALLGRFFFGVGAEFILVCLLTYSVFYFKGKELSMVQCLTMSIARLGSSVVFLIAHPILEFVRQFYKGEKDIGIVLFIMGTFTTSSVISAFILSTMDPNRKMKESKIQTKSEKIKMSDVLHFGVPFWLAVVGSCAFCNNVYILLPFSQGFFVHQHGMTVEKANSVSSFFSMMAAVSAFFIGVLVDKTGREISFVILAFILAISAHLTMAFTSITPFFTMFVLAMSFSLLAASLFPLYAYIVPENMLATAYGAKQAIVNLTFSVIIILGGRIVDKYGYQALELFICSNVTVGLISAVLLWLYNYKNGTNLNWSAKRRKRHQTEEMSKDVSEPLNKGS